MQKRCARPGCYHVTRGTRKYCSRTCGWMVSLPKAHAKAEAVKRARYAMRLKQRLEGKTPAAIWRDAYEHGFNACWHGWMRKIRRGEAVLLKPRTRYEKDSPSGAVPVQVHGPYRPRPAVFGVAGVDEQRTEHQTCRPQMGKQRPGPCTDG